MPSTTTRADQYKNGNRRGKATRGLAKEQDLLVVAQALLDGKSQAEIALELGTSRDNVSHMVDTIRNRWREVRTEFYHGYVLQELQKLNQMEQEALEAWEFSKSQVQAVDENGTSAVYDVAGDPKFLELVLRIMDNRAKRLRLYDFDPRKANGSQEQAAIHILELGQGDYASAISAIADKIDRANGHETKAGATTEPERITRGSKATNQHRPAATSNLPGALRAI